MNTADNCSAEMFSLSVDATSQLIQASTVASSGLALTFTRSINLSLAIVAGIACIMIGSKIYRDALVSKTSGEFSWKDFSFKLTASSPGVFLVFFGAWLIFSVVSQRVNFGFSEDLQKASQSTIPSSMSINRNRNNKELILIKSQTDPVQKDCLPQKACAIRSIKFGVSGYGGDEILTSSSEIDAALSLAANNLKQVATKKLESDKNADVSENTKAIKIIKQLREGIISDSM